MKPTILFDGDVLAYQIGFALEKAVHWPGRAGGLWTLHVHAEEAGNALDNFVEEMMQAVDGGELIIVLSDDDDTSNFRYAIAADYKANRKGKRKPMIHAWLRQYMKDGYEVYQRPTLEGDDTLGILLTSDKIITRKKVCVSIDKDMRTVPGLHYNTNKPKEGIVEVTEDDADYAHMHQTLTGDTVDNYPGCKGVGPVAAHRILAGVEIDPAVPRDWNTIMWQQVVTAYEKTGLGEEEALRQARLARILRNTDYDFKKKKVILWTP